MTNIQQNRYKPYWLFYISVFILATTVATTAEAVTTNSSSITHGAMVDEDGKEEASLSKVTKFNDLAKKPVGVVFFSDRWYNGIKFPVETAREVDSTGAVPFLRLQPSDDYDGGSSKRLTNKHISAGNYDTQLKQYAADVKAYGKKVIMEYGVEVNGDWFSWSNEGPLAYKNAYKHLYQIFRDAGVTNVVWALHLDITDNGRGAKWYPGDFIGIIGTSCYGPKEYGQNGCISELNKNWRNFSSISKTAALGIFEWGIGDPADTKKTLDTLASDPKYSRIKLLQVWNEKVIPGYDEDEIPDGRINVTPENLKAYQDGIANPVYTSQFTLGG